MNEIKCKICNTNCEKLFKHEILKKYKIQYFVCPNCNFIQTEKPYWLKEAYKDPINKEDTGYMVRNIFYSKKISFLLYLLFGNKGKYLDYAGGYGVFVRLMRDNGFNFFWEDKYTNNIFAIGFEGSISDKYDAVTLFEVMEHIEDPVSEIKKILKSTDLILFSTLLTPQKAPSPEWWYFAFSHGQHISFYNKKTFIELARKLNLSYYGNSQFHVLSKTTISFWSKVLIKVSNLHKFNLFKIFFKPRTWQDYLKMSNQD